MQIYRYLLLFALGVTAVKQVEASVQKMNWSPLPQPTHKQIYERCGLLEWSMFDVCEHNAKKSDVFKAPLSEEIKRFFKSKHPHVARCNAYTTCMKNKSCNYRKGWKELKICNLYRMVVEEMQSCLTKIKNTMNIFDWNAEKFVGPAGFFRQDYHLEESWKSENAYNLLNCEDLRQHLRKFRKLISEHCFLDMWNLYYQLVQDVNPHRDLCYLEKLD